MEMRLVKAFVPCINLPARTSSRLLSAVSNPNKTPRVGIIGGGLAGLSTAYHLLQQNGSIEITIIDKAQPGAAGASSVAGGLLHPLSPRGKLVHLGLEGLSTTNTLLKAASHFESDTILRNEIYRLAVNNQHVSTLQQTAKMMPNLTQWIEPEELGWDQPEILGALRMHSGCKVVHMPTYLKGLWSACKSIGSGQVEWVGDSACTASDFDWKRRLSEFDSVVLCAGAGLFQNSIVPDELPVQLVRGQSVELSLEAPFDHAMLCGKYVSPLLEPNRVLIGATHEFEDEPFDTDRVEADLKERTYPFASKIWDGGTVDKITTGFRVQSNRGNYGRMPIVGKFDTSIHYNAWIFTGLSSRGLLYHGVFGKMLTSMMLDSANTSEFEHPDLGWWDKD